MKVITRQILANETPTRWRMQYLGPEGWRITSTGSSEEVYDNLKLLGASPDPEMVDKIIGNKSWTRVPECNECGKEKDTVVMVGEEPDYESNTAILCYECLESALKIINGE